MARDLDLMESALRHWVERASRSDGRTNTMAEREELAQLRKENRELRSECDIPQSRALRVSPSGFYAWQHRPESLHATRDRHLRTLIRASHAASRGAFGSPRVHADLIEQVWPSAESA